MIDFTLKNYTCFLETLLKAGFCFLTFEESMNHKSKSVQRANYNEEANSKVVLRHDVDLRPTFSLKTALIENSLGIKGSYFFRIVPESFNEEIIKEIANLGHEIGYHYEDLTFAKGNHKEGIKSFEKNLTMLRKIYPVNTICMHGSPRSPWDSKDLWKHYDYKDFGIIGEPYLDIDFSKVLYLTDTGRRWDGEKFSVRDKVNGSLRSKYNFHSTSDIIKAAENNELPDQIMITVHPQRWTDRPLPWVRELVMQNVKNLVKRWWYV